MDITHDRAASEATEAYFEGLGAPKGTPYHEALKIVAQKQIKEEYRQGYVETFTPEHVLEVYAQGTDNLTYDFLITTDGVNYYWMRINAHMFTWQEDGSVHMLTYRQNIDAEKRQQQFLFEKMQQDSLTGLYNKAAVQGHITDMLQSPCGAFAFFILDIDDFKLVNDRFGHATGDMVLEDFARTLQAQFQENDLVGRIGGDEFVAFISIRNREDSEKKAAELTHVLHRTVNTNSGVCQINVSIGVALSPEHGKDFETLYRHADTALYQAKKQGKNGFAFYVQDDSQN